MVEQESSADKGAMERQARLKTLAEYLFVDKGIDIPAERLQELDAQRVSALGAANDNSDKNVVPVDNIVQNVVNTETDSQDVVAAAHNHDQDNSADSQDAVTNAVDSAINIHSEDMENTESHHSTFLEPSFSHAEKKNVSPIDDGNTDNVFSNSPAPLSTVVLPRRRVASSLFQEPVIPEKPKKAVSRKRRTELDRLQEELIADFLPEHRDDADFENKTVYSAKRKVSEKAAKRSSNGKRDDQASEKLSNNKSLESRDETTVETSLEEQVNTSVRTRRRKNRNADPANRRRAAESTELQKSEDTSVIAGDEAQYSNVDSSAETKSHAKRAISDRQSHRNRRLNAQERRAVMEIEQIEEDLSYDDIIYTHDINEMRQDEYDDYINEIDSNYPDIPNEYGDDSHDEQDASDDYGSDEVYSRRRRNNDRKLARSRRRSQQYSRDDYLDNEAQALVDASEEMYHAKSVAKPFEEDDSSEAPTVVRRRRRRRNHDTNVTPADIDVTSRSRKQQYIDEITNIEGSTRLEAKRLRRRDNRRERARQNLITEQDFLARRENVNRKMVIRETARHTQVSVIEDDILVEHYVSDIQEVSMVGNIYVGRVQNILPSMEAAFIDIGRARNGVLYAGEVNWDSTRLEGSPRRIELAYRSGDPILVQVTKDPIGHKGARLTSQITLAGRFLVLVPLGGMTGVSRKLPERERTRLKSIVTKIAPPDMGIIIRTAAEGASKEAVEKDLENVLHQWERICELEKEARNAKGPQLLKGEDDVVIRVIRDIFNDDFNELVVQGDSVYERIHNYLVTMAPDLLHKLHRWSPEDEQGVDVFDRWHIDSQLRKGMERKVYLPSGGSLVIDRTEAMTTIDVNTGRFVGHGKSLEETVTRCNLEAAEEIARQLRLRDIGGMVMIDFVDMVLEANRDLVLRRLVECLARDRTKHQVAEVTSLGLVQMTRKRIGQGLVEAFSEECPTCRGRGFILHDEPTINADADDPYAMKGGDPFIATDKSGSRGDSDRSQSRHHAHNNYRGEEERYERSSYGRSYAEDDYDNSDREQSYRRRNHDYDTYDSDMAYRSRQSHYEHQDYVNRQSHHQFGEAENNIAGSSLETKEKLATIAAAAVSSRIAKDRSQDSAELIDNNNLQTTDTVAHDQSSEQQRIEAMTTEHTTAKTAEKSRVKHAKAAVVVRAQRPTEEQSVSAEVKPDTVKSLEDGALDTVVSRSSKEVHHRKTSESSQELNISSDIANTLVAIADLAEQSSEHKRTAEQNVAHEQNVVDDQAESKEQNRELADETSRANHGETAHSTDTQVAAQVLARRSRPTRIVRDAVTGKNTAITVAAPKITNVKTTSSHTIRVISTNPTARLVVAEEPLQESDQPSENEKMENGSGKKVATKKKSQKNASKRS